MRNWRIEYHDAEPDALGRRRYTLHWEEPEGIFRPEPHPDDGEPVGCRRAQCFFAAPPDLMRGGGVIRAGYKVRRTRARDGTPLSGRPFGPVLEVVCVLDGLARWPRGRGSFVVLSDGGIERPWNLAPAGAERRAE